MRKLEIQGADVETVCLQSTSCTCQRQQTFNWDVGAKMLRQSQIARQRMNIQHGGIPVNYLPRVRAPLFYLRQNCTTPPFNRNFGIFLGWHVIIWDGSQVKAFPNPDHPPLAIFLTYQAFCTGMKILHLILLRCIKLKSESFLLL